MNWSRRYAGVALTIALALTAAGCKSATADFHAAASATLGVLTAAANNPAAVDEAKALLVDLATKTLTPTDTALVNQALGHVTAGAVGNAIAIVTPLVTASAPAASSPVSGGAWVEGEDDTDSLSLGERRLRAGLWVAFVVVLLSLVAAVASGCCAPPPPRLDAKKCDAYLDSVATVISMLEANVPEEQRALTVERCEPINAAGRKLLAR